MRRKPFNTQRPLNAAKIARTFENRSPRIGRWVLGVGRWALNAGLLVTAFLTGIPPLITRAAADTIETDLLIVGGNESGCAAAVQAARLGVKRIVLVNDIQWLGGQFSAEAVGAVDEWTTYRGKRVNFPRSGLFLEVIRRIRALNSRKFGLASPGNAVCASETVEPAEAARIFEELLAPYAEGGTGQVRVLRPWQPLRVVVEGNRVAAVEFSRAAGGQERLTVRARLTMDCSDWGDVIRLSGARYGAGPDLKERFGEQSAPKEMSDAERSEMNPISCCLVVRETDHDATISRPPGYDPRSFAALKSTPAFIDSAFPEGIYSIPNQSIYTHRRLVDRWHNGLAAGTEKVLLNWPVQDYPLLDFPKRVADALETAEAGASRKNIVNMTLAQRGIVFEGAKQHALGLLHHLQTTTGNPARKSPGNFCYMELTDEFGTPDRLPPKVYVREGLRLEALYMLREQDIRAADRNPRWAKAMVPDSVFGFQFNIDFHPTRRKFLDAGDTGGPWQFVHTPARSWHTDTDRAMFPLRGLVPVERDGLLGGSKNIGVSSIVSSALRLHGQMMHVGQASATLAWICLRDGVEPRAVAADFKRIREVQQRLVRGAGGPGVLLWPWHDLAPDEMHFEAANMLAVRDIWTPDADSLDFQQRKNLETDTPVRGLDADSLDFQPWKNVTRRELARALVRLCRSLPQAKDWPQFGAPRFSDVPAKDPDRAAIEAMVAWGDFGPQEASFSPDAEATWGTLGQWLRALRLPASAGLPQQAKLPLTRAECVRHLWHALQQTGEWMPNAAAYLQAGNDADHDDRPDLDDPLPFDHENNGIPDRLRSPLHSTPSR